MAEAEPLFVHYLHLIMVGDSSFFRSENFVNGNEDRQP
jgi:hypothetical protein